MLEITAQTSIGSQFIMIRGTHRQPPFCGNTKVHSPRALNLDWFRAFFISASLHKFQSKPASGAVRCRSPPPPFDFRQTQKNRTEEFTMATINLRDYYPWYTQDEFLEVSDEVAAELAADQRYQKTHEQRVRRNKSFYSLDRDDGIELDSIVCYNDCPERIFDMMERYCALCRALNALPEIQGRRIDAHFLLGISQPKIAEDEGVSEVAVYKSIVKGLTAMEKSLRNFS
jgi:RNA polymerase sigma-70 factor (ECF subfamily)